MALQAIKDNDIERLRMLINVNTEISINDDMITLSSSNQNIKDLLTSYKDEEETLLDAINRNNLDKFTAFLKKNPTAHITNSIVEKSIEKGNQEIQKILKYAMQNQLFNQITGISMTEQELKLVRQKINHLVKEKKMREKGIDRFHEILANLWKAREIASRQMESEYVNVVKRQRAGGKKRSSRRTKKRYSAYIR